VVKKIVPRYIGALDEVVPYKDYLEGGNDAEFMSPLRYWRTMFTTELEDTTTEEAERYVILVGTEEFGVYLEAAAHV
jgi:hypothetical protein